MKRAKHCSDSKIVEVRFIKWTDEDTTENYYYTGRIILVKSLMLNAFVMQYCSFHNGDLTIDRLRFNHLCKALRYEDITNNISITRK